MGWKALSRERKWMIFAGLLICGGGQGILMNTLSVFVKPVSDVLSFSRGAFTLYSSIASLVAMLMLPIYGNLYQRRSFPKLMAVSAVVCSLTPLGWSFCTSLPAFYILAAVLGVFFQGVSITGVSTVLNRWFGKNRGLASGICFSGSGVFAAILLSVSGTVIQRFGWQWGYRVISLSSFLLLTVGSGIICHLERRCPCASADDPELMETVGQRRGQELTRREAMRTWSFWGALLAAFLIAFLSQSGGSSVAAYLADLGYSAGFQRRLASVSMFSLAIGKILVGRLLDRRGMRAGMTLVAAAAVGYAVALILMRWPVSTAFYVLFYSVAACGSSVVVSYMVSTCFGRREYAAIYALVNIAIQLGVSLGSVIPGTIFDASGTYLPAWYLLAVLSVLVSVCYSMVQRDHTRRHHAALCDAAEAAAPAKSSGVQLSPCGKGQEQIHQT